MLMERPVEGAVSVLTSSRVLLLMPGRVSEAAGAETVASQPESGTDTRCDAMAAAAVGDGTIAALPGAAVWVPCVSSSVCTCAAVSVASALGWRGAGCDCSEGDRKVAPCPRGLATLRGDAVPLPLLSRRRSWGRDRGEAEGDGTSEARSTFFLLTSAGRSCAASESEPLALTGPGGLRVGNAAAEAAAASTCCREAAAGAIAGGALPVTVHAGAETSGVVGCKRLNAVALLAGDEGSMAGAAVGDAAAAADDGAAVVDALADKVGRASAVGAAAVDLHIRWHH